MSWKKRIFNIFFPSYFSSLFHHLTLIPFSSFLLFKKNCVWKGLKELLFSSFFYIIIFSCVVVCHVVIITLLTTTTKPDNCVVFHSRKAWCCNFLQNNSISNSADRADLFDPKSTQLFPQVYVYHNFIIHCLFPHILRINLKAKRFTIFLNFFFYKVRWCKEV